MSAHRLACTSFYDACGRRLAANGEFLFSGDWERKTMASQQITPGITVPTMSALFQELIVFYPPTGHLKFSESKHCSLYFLKR